MKNITIYSTPTCTYCNAAKDFFKKNKFKYTEYDVATDVTRRNEMVEKSGQMGVPVIEIGSDLIIGFDKSKISILLGIK